ncbi:alpha/beta fold hydrolase [Rhodobacter calidifons]|uniref:Alpha/beta fold hydrolase n=1 Tax=Rhodobacter calidifons TaxID=2715277 RepID=A0ABX0G3P5_9RHOB|nr:alpha/beta fold hydrolase [Rhodobacter calidifons]NHB75479.1 alpha/beta fold hydrolase [Rhodobacter calidifons]
MTLVWLDDLRLDAEVAGPPSAPPIVLVHGLGLDGRLWQSLLPGLTGHRVLRLDLRGHGASDAPAPPYAMGAMIRDVERLMDHFALKEAIVLGAGEGGLIAQGLAVKRLDLVRGLVLTGAATRFANPSVWQVRLARLHDAGPDLDAECAALLGPRWRTSPAQAEVRAMLETTRRAGWAGFASAIASADFYRTTATLRLPTLVLAGADDRRTPPDLQRELADLVAGSTFRLIRGGSHLPMLTHADGFLPPLRDFLSAIGHLQT